MTIKTEISSLAISVLMLYTVTMLKRGKEKTYQLYKKDKKSFSKASCKAAYRAKFTASQLRGSCAQINLQSNTDKFTHIKNRKGLQERKGT